MNDLVIQRNDEAVTTSLKVAEIFHKRHDAILRDIRSLDCSDEFTAHNFVESRYKDSSGKYNQMFYLTKDGFTFLVMGYRGKKAAKFKESYIKAFNKMEKLLTEKATTEWLETRQQGKITRNAETDMIKQLVEYAKHQGSKHPDKLYLVYSKLANEYAGIDTRDNATISQLNMLSIYEGIALNMIREGMALDKNYKQIYQDTKTRFGTVRELAFLTA